MRKGQTEIMGLAIVVILVTLGLFFAVMFGPKTPSKSIVKEYSNEELSQDFVITLLNTETECGYDFNKLIRDCAANLQEIECYEMSSCDYMNLTIETILNRTFYNWDSSFTFRIEKNNEDIILFDNTGCTETSEKGSQGIQPVTLYPFPGQAYIRLDVCYQ
jgi:hypothetical protein